MSVQQPMRKDVLVRLLHAISFATVLVIESALASHRLRQMKHIFLSLLTSVQTLSALDTPPTLSVKQLSDDAFTQRWTITSISASLASDRNHATRRRARMQADSHFSDKPEYFFDATRLISERFGYSTRRSKTKDSEVKTISQSQARSIFDDLSIVEDKDTKLSDVCDYINFRAELLNSKVQPDLMDRAAAKALYESEKAKHSPKTPPIMNKQKGDKKHESYLACLVQTQAEAIVGFGNFNNDPQQLAFLTDSEGNLSKCFARRFDGATPGIKNPKVVWEIKEYYGTTTFGSRVADGVYETLLDGFEIKQARARGHTLHHYLFVDDNFTWWTLGKSYLCRIIDMLHTGHVNRVYFGRQVVTEFPQALKEDLYG